MEGLRLVRLARPARASRPMALLGAVATLLAALFLCLGPSGHAADADGHRGAVSARAGGAVSLSLPASGAVRPFEAYRAVHDGTGGRYACPLDGRHCGLLPSLTPAVLTAPPLDPPLHAHSAAAPARAPAPEPPSAAWSVPRAPDLHVLQVLRT
ncbi:hypothetical protein [Streptomyces sp. CC228A]|uniref:hypothetical protein n=1 Tax=Streptomyces sp. CC228A TaxID=2898186 RepID=UPI001F1EB03B|nr:hypothetical protein [Streptomyces sp. CC228A]